MTDTTEMVEMIDPVTGEIIDQKQLVEQLLAQAKAQGDLFQLKCRIPAV